jgi:ATP-dependent Clp protease adapter protein ClpS
VEHEDVGATVEFVEIPDRQIVNETRAVDAAQVKLPPSHYDSRFEGAVDGLVLHQNGDHAAPKWIEAKETERHSVSDIASGLLSEVRLLNDDYTPMEFVVYALEWVFGKDRETAARIMLEIHNEGVGVCGIYPHHVADAKVTEVFDLARQHKHPLQCVRERITTAC